MGKVTILQWVALFREVGLTDADMKKWHHLFETKNPVGHQSFLEWLGLDAEEIRLIRERYQKPGRAHEKKNGTHPHRTVEA